MNNLALALFVRVRPDRWLPPALSLRWLRPRFEAGSTALAERMRAQLPAGGRVVRPDLSYAPGRDGLFDLVVPDGPGPHPVVVWAHGGGWYFGSKADVRPYLELLATHGFASLGINYPRIPEHAHPAAPQAALTALRHLVANSREYDLDPTRIVLAGDSAGAQIMGSAAIACTNPAYAEQLGLAPPQLPGPLRGVVLFCGTWDEDAVLTEDRWFSVTIASGMWSLGRDRTWAGGRVADLITLRRHVTGAFPPTFLRGGNADPLIVALDPLADRLRDLGVDVDVKTLGSAADPAPHTFQFQLESVHARDTVGDLVAFLSRVSA